MSHQVKLLQSSCCSHDGALRNQIESAAKTANFDCNVEELSELQDTLQYGTTSFPSLVVDNLVVDLKMFDTDEKLVALFNKLQTPVSCCN